MDEYAIEMKNITKKFGGLIAVDNVNFFVKKGEVVALCGENGAGKSTLMNVLTGKFRVQTYQGDIYIDGQKKRINSPIDARKNGISIVHQELELIPDLTIAENIFLGNLPIKGIWVDKKAMKKKAAEILSKFSLNLNPDRLIKSISVGQQQLVEIAKCIYLGGKILILDEPTAPLTEREIDFLMETIAQLRKAGISIVYITHRLEEVFRIADRAVVMRDGQEVGTFNVKDIQMDDLITSMIGRKLENVYPTDVTTPGEVTLELGECSVKNPNSEKNIVDNVSMKFRAGEIVGISGLLGAGRTELMSAVIGAYTTPIKGTVKLNGKNVHFRNPESAIEKGIGYVTEDRKNTGLILNQSIRTNISLASLNRVSKAGILNIGSEKKTVGALVKELGVKTSNIENNVSSLSGGNQQKVVLAKWLGTKPGILILDEPTRGVDVGSRYEIYSIMKRLAKENVTIIMISSDLPEVIGMSDRVYVMYEGKLQGELQKNELSEANIMRYATGQGHLMAGGTK